MSYDSFQEHLSGFMQGPLFQDTGHLVRHTRGMLSFFGYRRENGLKLSVSDWKPIFCKDLQLSRSINSASLENFTSLWCLSSNFISKTLRISNGHPLFSVKFLVEEAIKYSSPTSTREKINEILSTMEPTKARELSGLVEKYARI
jgi:hypothetical protein